MGNKITAFNRVSLIRLQNNNGKELLFQAAHPFFPFIRNAGMIKILTLISFFVFLHVVSLSAYTVYYDGNGNTVGKAPVDNNNYHNGDKVTTMGNTGTLEKTGYNFDGWNTKPDGSGTTYNQENELLIVENVTMYALWTLSEPVNSKRSTNNN